MNWMNQCHRYQYGRAGSERYWVVFRELIISLKRTHTPVAVDYAPVGSRCKRVEARQHEAHAKECETREESFAICFADGR